MAKGTRWRRCGWAGLLIVLGGCSAAKGPSMLEMSQQQQAAFTDCQKELRTTLKPTTLPGIVDTDGACFDRLDRESSLVTTRIRHNAYVIQQQQTRELMWLVVGITFGGVALAAMQLIAGFRLANAGRASFEKSQGGSIAVEAHKLSVNSSVSGVLVLALSLCFFYIFTERVYLIQEDGSTGKQSQSAGSSGGTVGTMVNDPTTGVQPVSPDVEKEAEREKAHR